MAFLNDFKRFLNRDFIGVFKDRVHAGNLLADAIKEYIYKHKIDKKEAVVFSLLRGGYVLGEVVSQRLGIPNIPLIVAKIRAPGNPEVAWGAAAIQGEYLNPSIDKQLKHILSQDQYLALLNHAKNQALLKIRKYLKKFKIDPKKLKQHAKNKIAFVVDDGVATGATAYAAAEFLRKNGAKKVILAVPVSPLDFSCKPYFDDCIILLKDPNFMAVGQYYQDFSEVDL